MVHAKWVNTGQGQRKYIQDIVAQKLQGWESSLQYTFKELLPKRCNTYNESRLIEK